MVVSAQTFSQTPATVSSSAPALYAELDQANSFSSSNLPDAPAAGFAAFAAGAPAPVVNNPGSTKPFSSVGVGFTIGFGGIGFQLATPLVPGILNVRGGAGFFSYTYNGTIDNDPTNATLKLDNAEVMVDVFPFKGSFRLSAGTTVYNKAGVTGTVTEPSGQSLSIGNNKYISAPTTSTTSPLAGNLALGFGGKAVPRFSLGWGNMVSKKGHIKFETEFGVEITQTPTTSWTYSGDACLQGSSSGSTPTCATGSTYGPLTSATAMADIQSQNATLQSDVSSVKVFPIFQLGLSYKIGH
jgi:hypothetical protein